MRTSGVRALLMVAALAGSSAPGVGAQPAPGVEYRFVAAGRFRPIFAAGVPDSGVAVGAFRLASRPVTNAEFLRFVAANPVWRRSQVPRVAADSRYLRHWSGDLTLGPNAPPASPVVNVSWFTASAYANWVHGRLPTTAEWELAASRFRRTLGPDPDRLNARLLEWYGSEARAILPAAGRGIRSDDGVRDLHGLVWEWVDDFNAVVTSGESRGDSGPDAGLFCAGGAALAADPSNYAAFMRYALRGSLRGSYTLATLGFRVARDVARYAPGTVAGEPATDRRRSAR